MDACWQAPQTHIDGIYLQMCKCEKDGREDERRKCYEVTEEGKPQDGLQFVKSIAIYSEKLYPPSEIHIPSVVPGKRNRCVARSVEGSGLTELPSAEDGLAEVVISSSGSDDSGSKTDKLGL